VITERNDLKQLRKMQQTNKNQ